MRLVRLSEAIVLGSTVVKPKAGALRFHGEDSGCALGMAVIATGGRFRRVERPLPEAERRTLNVEDIWGPWILRRIGRPCDCGVHLVMGSLRRRKIGGYRRMPFSALPREMRIKDIVAHLFDYHVIERRDWTLDRLVSWLQPLEPAEAHEDALLDEGEASSEDAEWGKDSSGLRGSEGGETRAHWNPAHPRLISRGHRSLQNGADLLIAPWHRGR
jgi:hypothetical protein